MPSVRVAGSTLLLSKRGWLAVERMPSSDAALGADRHGSMEERAVSLAPSQELGRTAFLGTSAAFAEFSPATRVLAYDGTGHELAQLIETAAVGNVRFETLIDLPDDCTFHSAHELIWPILRSAAAIEDGERVAVRCRDSSIAATGSIKTRQFAKQRYCLFDRLELRGTIERATVKTILAIGRLWLRNDDEMRLELERAFHIFAALYVAGLRREKLGYRLGYDTLQHTAYVFIIDSVEAPAPVAKGACACYGTSAGREFRVAWHGAGWNPIGSGFLLAPD